MKKLRKKKLKYTIYLIMGIILFLSGLFLINYIGWLGWVLIIIGSIFIFIKMFKIRKINISLENKIIENAVKRLKKVIKIDK